MRFAHMADIHLGSWRQPEMSALNLEAFKQAISTCIKKQVEFVLIVGDLFDSAMPSIDILKETVSELKKLKDNNIKCYLISGSHDYSITGKTFLDVLERADLCKNVHVMKDNCLEIFSEDSFVLCGISGKKASLEQEYFKHLKINNYGFDKNKFKIFLLHTTLTESKPEEMSFVESVDIADLPDGFDYYAAGHLHLVDIKNKNRSYVIYPGPIFPNNIAEIEALREGSFFIVDVQDNKVIPEKQTIKLKEILTFEINADGLSSEQLTTKVVSKLKKADVKDKIVILKLKGCLASGKTVDINFDAIREAAASSYILLKSTSGLTTPELKLELKIKTQNINEIEYELIKNYKEKAKNENFSKFFCLIKILLDSLDIERHEGEKREIFETRLMQIANKIFNFEK